MKRDGLRGHCPLCRATLPVPKDICGESPCPRCRGVLWHLVLASGPIFFVQRARETIYDLLADLLPSREGLSAADLERILREADSLDVAEFLSVFEGAIRS